MAKHTPTPWTTDLGWVNTVYDVAGPDGKPICMVAHGDIDEELRAANAAFIVKAVNSHHPMRDALLRLEQACEQLAATRSHAIYTAMIDGGQTQALLELDNARRCAREALNGVVGTSGSGS